MVTNERLCCCIATILFVVLCTIRPAKSLHCNVDQYTGIDSVPGNLFNQTLNFHASSADDKRKCIQFCLTAYVSHFRRSKKVTEIFQNCDESLIDWPVNFNEKLLLNISCQNIANFSSKGDFSRNNFSFWTNYTLPGNGSNGDMNVSLFCCNSNNCNVILNSDVEKFTKPSAVPNDFELFESSTEDSSGQFFTESYQKSFYKLGNDSAGQTLNSKLQIPLKHLKNSENLHVRNLSPIIHEITTTANQTNYFTTRLLEYFVDEAGSAVEKIGSHLTSAPLFLKSSSALNDNLTNEVTPNNLDTPSDKTKNSISFKQDTTVHLFNFTNSFKGISEYEESGSGSGGRADAKLSNVSEIIFTKETKIANVSGPTTAAFTLMPNEKVQKLQTTNQMKLNFTNSLNSIASSTIFPNFYSATAQDFLDEANEQTSKTSIPNIEKTLSKSATVNSTTTLFSESHSGDKIDEGAESNHASGEISSPKSDLSLHDAFATHSTAYDQFTMTYYTFKYNFTQNSQLQKTGISTGGLSKNTIITTKNEIDHYEKQSSTNFSALMPATESVLSSTTTSTTLSRDVTNGILDKYASTSYFSSGSGTVTEVTTAESETQEYVSEGSGREHFTEKFELKLANSSLPNASTEPLTIIEKFLTTTRPTLYMISTFPDKTRKSSRDQATTNLNYISMPSTGLTLSSSKELLGLLSRITNTIHPNAGTNLDFLSKSVAYQETDNYSPQPKTLDLKTITSSYLISETVASPLEKSTVFVPFTNQVAASSETITRLIHATQFVHQTRKSSFNASSNKPLYSTLVSSDSSTTLSPSPVSLPVDDLTSSTTTYHQQDFQFSSFPSTAETAFPDVKNSSLETSKAAIFTAAILPTSQYRSITNLTSKTTKNLPASTYYFGFYNANGIKTHNLVSILLFINFRTNILNKTFIDILEEKLRLSYISAMIKNNRNDPHNTISRQEGHRQVRNLLQSGENIEVKVAEAIRRSQHSVEVRFAVYSNGEELGQYVVTATFGLLSHKELSKTIGYPVLSPVAAVSAKHLSSDDRKRSKVDLGGFIAATSILSVALFLLLASWLWSVYFRKPKKFQTPIKTGYLDNISDDSLPASSSDSTRACFGSQLLNEDVEKSQSFSSKIVVSKQVQTCAVRIETEQEVKKMVTLKFSKKLQTDFETISVVPEKKQFRTANTQTEAWKNKTQDVVSPLPSKQEPAVYVNSKLDIEHEATTIEKSSENLLKKSSSPDISKQTALSFLPMLPERGMPLILQPIQIEENTATVSPSSCSINQPTETLPEKHLAFSTLKVQPTIPSLEVPPAIASLEAHPTSADVLRAVQRTLHRERQRNKKRIMKLKKKMDSYKIDQNVPIRFNYSSASLPSYHSRSPPTAIRSTQPSDFCHEVASYSPDETPSLVRPKTKQRKKREKQKRNKGENLHHSFDESLRSAKETLDSLVGDKDEEVFSPSYKKYQVGQRMRWKQKTYPVSEIAFKSSEEHPIKPISLAWEIDFE